MKDEIIGLIEEEFLPYVETTKAKRSAIQLKRDPDDAKFIECALAAQVPWIVSGDADLLDLGSYKSIQIVTVNQFLHFLRQ